MNVILAMNKCVCPMKMFLYDLLCQLKNLNKEKTNCPINDTQHSLETKGRQMSCLLSKKKETLFLQDCIKRSRYLAFKNQKSRNDLYSLTLLF